MPVVAIEGLSGERPLWRRFGGGGLVAIRRWWFRPLARSHRNPCSSMIFQLDLGCIPISSLQFSRVFASAERYYVTLAGTCPVFEQLASALPHRALMHSSVGCLFSESDQEHFQTRFMFVPTRDKYSKK